MALADGTNPNREEMSMEPISRTESRYQYLKWEREKQERILFKANLLF
jgi:hypothetical protein